jgi:DNA polymerase III sliding clamp (beta) subunit (PCNA family)
MDLKREDLIEAVNLVTVVNDWDKIRISMSETDELKIEAQNIGQANEYVALQNVEGENIALTLNPKFLYEALKVTQGEIIRIGFTGKNSPFVLSSLDDPYELHLLLPCRE